MDITIRPAREEDAPSIVDLLNPIIDAGRFTFMTENQTVANQIAFMRSLSDRAHYLVAVRAEDVIVGIQDVQPIHLEAAWRHAGAISTFVAVGAQRQGVGRRLFEAMRVAAVQAGYASLVAIVRTDNPGALAFYRNQGFETMESDGPTEFTDQIARERKIMLSIGLNAARGGHDGHR